MVIAEQWWLVVEANTKVAEINGAEFRLVNNHVHVRHIRLLRGVARAATVGHQVEVGPTRTEARVHRQARRRHAVATAYADATVHAHAVVCVAPLLAPELVAPVDPEVDIEILRTDTIGWTDVKVHGVTVVDEVGGAESNVIAARLVLAAKSSMQKADTQALDRMPHVVASPPPVYAETAPATFHEPPSEPSGARSAIVAANGSTAALLMTSV